MVPNGTVAVFRHALLVATCFWLVFFTAEPAQAFRFVCNSVDAQGVPSGDICGQCNATVAARWPGASVNWQLHANDRPTNVSVDDFVSAASGATEQWSQVEQAGLDATVSSVDGVGTWGANDINQDVIWVQGAPETWQALTFTNPATTIALTAVRYRCQGGDSSYREIFDADIALNNTGLPWACDAPGCWSLEHTLLHEVGHGIGLGHGCGQCETSVMVALADPAYQPLLLTDDDIQGCVALYPLGAGDPDEDAEPGPEVDAERAVDAQGDSGDVTADRASPSDCECTGGQPGSGLLFVSVALWLLLRRRGTHRLSRN